MSTVKVWRIDLDTVVALHLAPSIDPPEVITPFLKLNQGIISISPSVLDDEVFTQDFWAIAVSRNIVIELVAVDVRNLREVFDIRFHGHIPMFA